MFLWSFGSEVHHVLQNATETQLMLLNHVLLFQQMMSGSPLRKVRLGTHLVASDCSWLVALICVSWSFMHLVTNGCFCRIPFCKIHTVLAPEVWSQSVDLFVWTLSCISLDRAFASIALHITNNLVRILCFAVQRILDSRTITATPAMAPACGLYLAEVKYDFDEDKSKDLDLDDEDE